MKTNNQNGWLVFIVLRTF